MRAAAFSFGVLTELNRSRAGSDQAKSLLDRVDFISGVSGGSVTAAYFGLKKRAALDDFRERFLLRNAEEGLNTRVSLGNIGRALGGGVNDSQFTNWLDRNLFDGARFDAFREDRRPRVWINASDIYNRTPFVFGKTAFDALCSDISTYRVAEAVAASAAVPLAFAPIVLETFPGGCAIAIACLDRARAPRSERATVVAVVRGSHCALSRWLDALCEAARRRPRRQFRPVRFQYRAARGAASVPADDRTAGGKGAADDVPRRRCRPWYLRRLRAADRGTQRRRTGIGRGRYRHRRQRTIELHGVLGTWLPTGPAA